MNPLSSSASSSTPTTSICSSVILDELPSLNAEEMALVRQIHDLGKGKRTEEKEKKIRELTQETIDHITIRLETQYNALPDAEKYPDRFAITTARATALSAMQITADCAQENADPEIVLRQYALTQWNYLMGYPMDESRLATGDADWLHDDRNAVPVGTLKEAREILDVVISDNYAPERVSLLKKFIKWAGGLDYQPGAAVQSSYELAVPRSYAGIGGSVEFWVPFTKKAPHFVLGSSLETSIRFGIADPNLDPDLTRPEIKTMEGVIFPVIFQGGYHSDSWTLLVQGGFSLTAAHVPESEYPYDPYSPKNPFLNPVGRVGVEAYVWQNRIMLAAGYQGSPWGPGAYFKAGYHFGKKEER